MVMRTAALVLFCSAALTLTAAEVGKPSPPLTIQRVGSPPIQLTQYRGKVVLLVFILTTCPHCQQLTRDLAPIAHDYEARGVQIVECAFNQGAEQAIPGFVQALQPAFPVGWADNATVMSYVGRSLMETTPFYVPHTVFLDRRGVVQGEYAGESDFMKTPDASIRAELEKLLKSAPPTTASKSPVATKSK